MFLDIGSGSGRVLGLAFKHGSTIKGIEIEKDFYNNSQFKEWVTLVDYKEIDFSIYDILFYFQKGIDDEKKLAEKINKEARGIIIIYRRGSSNEEAEELIYLLNGRIIERFKYLNVLSYT
jgi:hypothetical protein